MTLTRSHRPFCELVVVLSAGIPRLRGGAARGRSDDGTRPGRHWAAGPRGGGTCGPGRPPAPVTHWRPCVSGADGRT